MYKFFHDTQVGIHFMIALIDYVGFLMENVLLCNMILQ